MDALFNDVGRIENPSNGVQRARTQGALELAESTSLFLLQVPTDSHVLLAPNASGECSDVGLPGPDARFPSSHPSFGPLFCLVKLLPGGEIV